jgi:hypothetical protein
LEDSENDKSLQQAFIFYEVEHGISFHLPHVDISLYFRGHGQSLNRVVTLARGL